MINTVENKTDLRMLQQDQIDNAAKAFVDAYIKGCGMLRAPEVAQAAGISYQTLYMWHKRGKAGEAKFVGFAEMVDPYMGRRGRPKLKTRVDVNGVDVTSYPRVTFGIGTNGYGACGFSGNSYYSNSGPNVGSFGSVSPVTGPLVDSGNIQGPTSVVMDGINQEPSGAPLAGFELVGVSVN